MRKTRLLLLIMLFFLTAGCAQTEQSAAPAPQRADKFEAIGRICVPDTENDYAMQAAEDVLAQMNFTIEKADIELGLIKTRPLRAAQFFELWRSDNIGSFNTAEANLHTIRRIAQINITRSDEQLCIDCEVKTQRLSLPQRRTSAARAYGLFSKSDSSAQRLQLDSEQKKTMTWVDLGQDKMLSTAILKKLEERLAETKEEQL